MEKTGLLTKCPACTGRLHTDNSKGIQFCNACGYWTEKNTARLDFLMLQD